MSIIINANNMEEYNQNLNYYQMNGFKIDNSSSAQYQTRLIKKNFGPIIVHVLLLVSLIGAITFLTGLVVDVLRITDLVLPLNLFSILLAIRYLQYIGIFLIILAIIMALIIVYYYVSKPYDVLIRFNQNLNNNMNYNNNFNNINRGNLNG
ncbi:hypothetical protein PXD04_08865 [Methanosphaera sp. ISO3-F5]|uniref:hypothetical protein n=1 Tax=Methanosphaera sp. ISO3-F5 TaxID=1452353 RepID=UPI002B2572B4|nr:hypothetical protein [Methanosphaera sp. ISO3-F5]WQH63801.1 hypothetical protein PXD04_08865 [Methanosphaera sp. ISO3-F5]